MTEEILLEDSPTKFCFGTKFSERSLFGKIIKGTPIEGISEHIFLGSKIILRRIFSKEYLSKDSLKKCLKKEFPKEYNLKVFPRELI